jgi:hypothetical protein
MWEGNGAIVSAAPGFEFDGDFGKITPERHELEIVARNRTGSEAVLARKSLIPREAMRLWSNLLDAHPSLAKPPFRFLMMTSAVRAGGAAEADKAYQTYISRTQQIGIAVPILYLRTTKGAAGDWVFDPDFDLTRKCEKFQVAEDSLNGVIRYAIEKKVPVHFILHGGIWADATCDTPEWDVNDHLEQDVGNCQWTQDNIVFPDDYTKNLVGSTDSPQLGRTLTYNVYASKVRHYKANLMEMGFNAVFARESILSCRRQPRSDTYMNPFFMYKEWFDYNPACSSSSATGSRNWPWRGRARAVFPICVVPRKDPLTSRRSIESRANSGAHGTKSSRRKFPARDVPVRPGSRSCGTIRGIRNGKPSGSTSSGSITTSCPSGCTRWGS